MYKKTLVGLFSAVAMMLAVVTPALAATQEYKFYYYQDTDNNGSLNIGDQCWRNNALLSRGMFMNNPPYNTWIYTNFNLSGSSFMITNTAGITTCKTSSSSAFNLTVGTPHVLKDYSGHSVYFTPMGGAAKNIGLIGGNSYH